jgi:hypothetical protein
MKYSNYYYEIYLNGCAFGFDELEDAIEYADANDVTMISQVGGSFTDYEKCAFCGEWVDCYELNEHGDCSRCEQAIKDHGGY